MHALPAVSPASDAVVVSSSVEHVAWTSDPVTVTRLRLPGGKLVTLRAVGGPSARGGRVFLADPAFPIVPAWKPNSPPAVWPTSALPVPFYLGLPRSRDLGADTDAEVDVALRTWGRAPCTAWRATFAGTTANPPGDDGVSGIYWHDDTWPAGLTEDALGTAVVHTDAQNQIYDVDIHLNGAGHTWSLDGHGDTVDARGLLTHELGHALGLGHTSDPTATMWPSYPPGLAWRSIEQDDRNGVCALYPGTGDAEGCEALPCPAGYTCVARTCERAGATQEVCSPCDPVAGACAGVGEDARCVDLPGGRVCGRSCAADADCGAGFRCLPTSGAGDLQCVSQDGCKGGPDKCTTLADCPPGAICSQGACMNALNADAGADAAPGDGEDGVITPGGGCNASGSRPSRWPLLLLLPLLWGRRRRERRTTTPPSC